MGQLVVQCWRLNSTLRKLDIDAEVGCKRTFFSHKAFIKYPDGTVNYYSDRSETRLSLYLLEDAQYLIRQKRDENQADTERRMSKLIAEIHNALCDQDKEKLDGRRSQCLVA